MSTESQVSELTALQSVPEFDAIIIAVVGLLAVLFASSAVYVRRKDTEDSRWKPDRLSEDQMSVVNHLKKEGGDASQKSVSEKLDWSDAKTSRVSSELIDINAVEKIRRDRQNYLTLNEEDMDGELN